MPKSFRNNRDRRSRLIGLTVMCSAFLVGTPAWSIPAHADPLTPFTPAEEKFIRDVYDAFPGSEGSNRLLVTNGWYACHLAAINIDPTATGSDIERVVARLAIADLCPHGCAEGCPPS